MPCALCACLPKLIAHLSPVVTLQSCLSASVLFEPFHTLVQNPSCLFSCLLFVCTYVIARRRLVQLCNQKLSTSARLPAPCTLACLSHGQEDAGISRDELLIDEAVIEVFKKVRGDYCERNEHHCLLLMCRG